MTRTLGVEEELLLVDAARGAPAACGSTVVADVGAADRVHGEFKEEQVEIASRPCRTLSELTDDLVERRAHLVALAAHHGLRVASSGTCPLPLDPTAVRNERFDRIAAEFTVLSTGQLTCGAHVHVAVGSRDEGVAVLDRVRPWLPLLTALTANSPFWQGRDTGYASYRSIVLSQLPTAGPTPRWHDVATYDRILGEVVGTGAAFDAAMIYYDARLSARYPTVEVRVADVCRTVGEAVLLAGLCRGLVDTAADGWRRGEPAPDVSTAVLRGAAWRAARHGMGGTLLDPAAGHLVPAWDAVGSLLSHVTPALRRTDDLDRVSVAMEEVRRRGTGADRQRAAFARSGDVTGVVADALLDATVRATADASVDPSRGSPAR